ncbi:MAG: hypothetical protein HRF49_10035 [bacterium]|jgi:hypothetical protein
MGRFVVPAICAAILAAGFACSGGIIRPFFENETDAAVFQIEQFNIPVLPKDAGVYQFWLAAGETRIPLYQFVVAGTTLWPPEYLDLEDPANPPPGMTNLGTLTRTESTIDLPEGVVKSAIDTVFLTLEPKAEDDGEMGQVLLAGRVNIRGRSNLTLDTQNAYGGLPDVFSGSGTAMLAAPTYVPTGEPDEVIPFFRGFWFVKTPEEGGAPIPGLVLPDLTPFESWTYQGWAYKANPEDETQSILLDLGRFDNPAAPDLDGAGSSAGEGTPYAAPGSDFINFLPEVDFREAGWQFYITVEPEPDNDESGFAWQILEATVPANATAETLITMDKFTGNQPFGIARIL